MCWTCRGHTPDKTLRRKTVLDIWDVVMLREVLKIPQHSQLVSVLKVENISKNQILNSKLNYKSAMAAAFGQGLISPNSPDIPLDRRGGLSHHRGSLHLSMRRVNTAPNCVNKGIFLKHNNIYRERERVCGCSNIAAFKLCGMWYLKLSKRLA